MELDVVLYDELVVVVYSMVFWYVIVVICLFFGWVFLWVFVDKLFGGVCIVWVMSFLFSLRLWGLSWLLKMVCL